MPKLRTFGGSASFPQTTDFGHLDDQHEQAIETGSDHDGYVVQDGAWWHLFCVVGIFVLLVYFCCWYICVVGISLLLVYLCCWYIFVVGIFLLLVYFCCWYMELA